MHNLKKNDKIIILTGKEKGKKGVISNIVKKIKKNVLSKYAIIKDINLVTASIKSNAKIGQKGGFIKKSMPIHVSNISLFNNKNGKSKNINFK